jgi:hypothetical protein
VHEFATNISKRAYAIYTYVTIILLSVLYFVAPVVVWGVLRFYTFLVYPLLVFIGLTILGTGLWVGDPFSHGAQRAGFDYQQTYEWVKQQIVDVNNSVNQPELPKLPQNTE